MMDGIKERFAERVRRMLDENPRLGARVVVDVDGERLEAAAKALQNLRKHIQESSFPEPKNRHERRKAAALARKGVRE